MNGNFGHLGRATVPRARPPGTHFDTYLRENPDARAALKERLKACPEYQQWLRQMDGDVLSALDEK